MNSEEWLEAAAVRLIDEFDLPDTDYTVHWGWPSVKGLSVKARRVGECWKPEAVSTGVPPIFISPVLKGGVETLSVLLHELIHAWDKGASGHRGAFATKAKSFGFEPPLTSSLNMSDDLIGRLRTISAALGEWPGAHITPQLVAKKPQKTYQQKLKAKECSCIARATKAYTDLGAFKCPHGNDMEVEASS